MLKPQLAAMLLALGLPTLSAAAPLVGDLDGDGQVGATDEALFQGLYGALAGDPLFDPAADANADGLIDVRDLAILGNAFGATGGDVDATPPALLVTLNDVPDDMNDLLVVPPEDFQITLTTDSAGGSLVDPASFSITSDQELGGLPPGAELASLFAATPTRQVYAVPVGADLARTSHYLTVQISDLAGNTAEEVYGFAVRDFGFGAPFANTQTVFVDFDQDRSLGPDVDFLEDLRHYGLTSTAAPSIEATVRDRVVQDALGRAREVYGLNADGSAGPDSVNIAFVDTVPAGPHARLCVGGESSLGALFLGATVLDPENLVPNEDTCSGTQLGVFPAALDNLWGGGPTWAEVFGPIDPDLLGTPIGEHPLDATVMAPGWGTSGATVEELGRFLEIEAALETFSSMIGTVIAHETGHLVGLAAHGNAPAGLFGGTSGANLDHNVTATGGTPTENWVMNAGNTFTIDELAGLNGHPLPVFRPIAQAYLRDRLALNQQVTGLFPAPSLSGVTPNPAVYPSGQFSTGITIDGADFFGTPIVELLREGSPTWDSVQGVNLVSSSQLTGSINVFVVIPGLYDVRVINPDGQAVVLEDHLTVVQE